MESVFYMSACTPSGFVSHFDSLLKEVKNVNIIKGGSGCGKSTFMKALARAARAKNYDVSYILCSSDPDSLDAIIIPELSICYVDGTAPHILEPKLCGGHMNYMNFGDFYDSAAMAANEAEILAVQKENAAQYPHITACLSAADRLLDSVRMETAAKIYHEEMTAIAECLILSNLQPIGGTASIRRRFLNAITPKGLQFCTQTPQTLSSRVYVLRDNYMLAPMLLQQVLQRASEFGHECIVCYSPLLPSSAPTHLIIPSAQVAIVSESHNFPYDGACFCRIDLDSTLPPQVRKELEFCSKTVSTLLYRAVRHMRKAKQHHDRIEQLCRPFVDFTAVDQLTTKTIGKLFSS